MSTRFIVFLSNDRVYDLDDDNAVDSVHNIGLSTVSSLSHIITSITNYKVVTDFIGADIMQFLTPFMTTFVLSGFASFLMSQASVDYLRLFVNTCVWISIIDILATFDLFD